MSSIHNGVMLLILLYLDVKAEWGMQAHLHSPSPVGSAVGKHGSSYSG